MYAGNGVVRTIFGYHNWESVRPLICELRRLNIVYELLVRKAKFYNSLYCKSGFLGDFFLHVLIVRYRRMYDRYFQTTAVVINDVYQSLG